MSKSWEIVVESKPHYSSETGEKVFDYKTMWVMEGSTHIAVVTSHYPARPDVAPLLAAAPELLQLIQDFWKYFQSAEDGLPPGCPSPEKVDIVLAKAEGRAIRVGETA